MPKILVLSDIHIGDPRLNIKTDLAICALLKQSYDYIILNGDIIDSWLDYEEAIEETRFLYLLDYMKNVFLVRGNHDPADEIIHKILPRVNIVESLNIGKYFFIHSHQVYPMKSSSILNYLGTKLNALVYRLFGIDMQSYTTVTKFYKNQCYKRRQQILDKYGSSDRIVIIGHTHAQITQSDGDKILYDGGSIVLSGHYIEILDNKVYLKKLP